MTVLEPTKHDCGCGGSTATSGSDTTVRHWCGASNDLPMNPFEALRVTYGMLLGEQDFRVMLGNPRGKLMLHNSWLHGWGVVWGLRVKQAGDQLQVQPGLAIDGMGRELRLELTKCLSLDAWVEKWVREHPPKTDTDPDCPPKTGPPKTTDGGCETVPLTAWVVADFSQCLDRAVPALASPCDVERQHTDYSRVVETVRLSIVSDVPEVTRPYHRVRVLLGIDAADPDPTKDKPGQEAVDALKDVQTHHGADRALALLDWFRRLAAADVMDLQPQDVEGDTCLPLTPTSEDAAVVVLARLQVNASVDGSCVTVDTADVDCSVRAALLPTATIQELTCGNAPGVIGQIETGDAGGPRLIRSSVEWTTDNTRVSFRVTSPIAPGSTENAIQVSSLADDGRGWARDDVERVSVSSDGLTVRVYLDQAPKYEVARLVISGTGPHAVFGANPRVPFAGVEGGPPGTQDDGHDAVATIRIAGQQPQSSGTSTGKGSS
jgi:hypothetical protein